VATWSRAASVWRVGTVMRVLVGEGTGGVSSLLKELGWGRMWIARTRNIYTYPGEPWGLDNGAYGDWINGRAFDEEAWLKVVDKAQAVPEKPYLAVLPDIVGGGQQSLAMSEAWLPRLPDFPWYLAVQDGMTPGDLAHLTDEIAGIFLGGTNGFKAQAEMWCEWAHDHGLRFHYGRAGTMNKVAHALETRADSLDSAFPMWTRERMALFVELITGGPIQKDLFWRGLS